MYVKFGVGGAATLTILSANPIKQEDESEGKPTVKYSYQVECEIKRQPVEMGGKEGSKLWWYATEKMHQQVQAAKLGKGDVVNVLRKGEKEYRLYDANNTPLPDGEDNPFTDEEKPSNIPPEQQQAQAEKQVAKRGDGAGRYDLRNLSGEPFLVDAFIAGNKIVDYLLKTWEAENEVHITEEQRQAWVSTCVIAISNDVSPRERAEAELRRVEELSTTVGTDDPDKVENELAGAQDSEKTASTETDDPGDGLPF